jgi:hypothetical protein
VSNLIGCAEYLIPGYMKKARPSYKGLPSKIGYTSIFSLQVTIPAGLDQTKIMVSLQDLGFSSASSPNRFEYR